MLHFYSGHHNKLVCHPFLLNIDLLRLLFCIVDDVVFDIDFALVTCQVNQNQELVPILSESA